jgi:hypothetical protein
MNRISIACRTPARCAEALVVTALLASFTASAQQEWHREDFGSPTLPPSWTIGAGHWGVKDGAASIPTPGYDELLGSPWYVYDTAPYSIETQLRGIRAGIFFALDGPSSKVLSHMVRFDEKNILTGYFTAAGEFVATNTFDSPVLPKEWTVLRVDVNPQAGQYRVFVNGVAVGTDERLMFRSGYVGLQGSEGSSEFDYVKVTGNEDPAHPTRPKRRSLATFQHVRFVRAGRGNVVIYNPELKLLQALDLDGKILQQNEAQKPPAEPAIRTLGQRTYKLEGNTIIVHDAENTRPDTIRDHLVAPSAILIDRDTVLYVADRGARAIHRISPRGTIVKSFTGASIGGLLAPGGIDFLGRDELVIADYNRLVVVKRSLEDVEPRVTADAPTEVTVTWTSASPGGASLAVAPEGGRVQIVPGTTLGETRRVHLTERTPLSRYTYTVTPALRTIPPGGGRSREYRFSTTPADSSMMSYARLPILCMMYRTISYRDRYPASAFPGVPDGRTLTGDEIEELKKGIAFNRDFYFRNSGCKLLLDFDFVLIEDTLRLSDVGDQDPYWLGPNERVTRDYSACARSLGKNPEDYAGLIVPYAWINYPLRRNSAPVDPSKKDTVSIRQAVGGGTYGVPAPWRYGKTTGYTSNPFQDRFSRQDWLITHEFHHQLDALLDASGFPEYHHADEPWKMPGRFGEDFDFNAHIIRNATPAWWLTLRFGSLAQTCDADHDGVPDDDPQLPFDERRLHGNPHRIDTDDDGLADLNEVMAGTSRGCTLDNPDTDGDGIPDGRDPEPLYAVTPVIRRTSSGQMTRQNLFGTWQSADLTASISLGWDDRNLFIATEADKPTTLLFQIDARCDGWFHGLDNIQLRVMNDGDSAHVVEYYLRDCSSWSDPPRDRRDLLKPADVRHTTTRLPAPSAPGDTTSAVGRLHPQPSIYRLAVAIPRVPAYGLALLQGEKVAIRIGLQTSNDRWVWNELFERNYMMVVELR